MSTGHPLLDWMEKNRISLTWDNYLRYAYGEDSLSDPPDALFGAEAMAEIPEEFQADIELYLQKQSGAIQ